MTSTSFTPKPPRADAGNGWPHALASAVRIVLILIAILIAVQSLIVVQFRDQHTRFGTADVQPD